MAFLHCHAEGCNWSQDDFWSKDGYHPFRKDIVDCWIDWIFQEKVYMDKFLVERIVKDPPFDWKERSGRKYKDYYVSGQELVAYELEQKAKYIREMNVKTNEEWEQVRDTWKCPFCGKSNWDID